MNSQAWSRTLAVITLAILAMLAGCSSSGPKIITNSAPDFNAYGYKTFSFMQPLSTDRGGVRSLDSQRLIAAATREMERFGLTRSDDNADLLINFYIASKETLQSRPATGVNASFGRGRYGRWGGYGVGMGTGTEVVQRTEGTLGVDVVDAAQNQLMWEGAATARVTTAMRENRQQALDSAIADIFAKFPN
jgi:hypothetical protein